MVMETRSRIGKGMLPGKNLKSGEQGQKGKEKDLQTVLEELERKQKSVKTIQIKQEVLEETKDPTEQETPSVHSQIRYQLDNDFDHRLSLHY